MGGMGGSCLVNHLVYNVDGVTERSDKKKILMLVKRMTNILKIIWIVNNLRNNNSKKNIDIL